MKYGTQVWPAGPQATPCDMTALAAREAVRQGRLDPLDIVDAAIARIEATDGPVNALPVRCFEQARSRALRMREDAAKGGGWPPLCGLTLAVKDNADVAGVPTSGGSAITAGRVPAVSDPVVALLERNGGIVIGKSNLSELGGANTTNALFGPTRNPWRGDLTAGGSSGGSAAALALGQVHLGHGNDVGGSLRTPAAFCGVAGLRPTPGLVPRKPLADMFDTVFVEGPMARTVADLGLMLDAMAGLHPGDPLSRAPAGGFLAAARSPELPPRLAASEDLGMLPVDPAVRAGFRTVLARLGAAGAAVEEAAPPLDGLPEAIRLLRGVGYLATWGGRWPHERERFTPEVAGDIALGQSLTGERIAGAMACRAAAYRRIIEFFAGHDLLLCPAVQVPPFAVDLHWPREIEGRACESYVDWIMITYVWSVLGCVAAAVPVGRDAGGLPVSLQIVGPPHAEARVLAFAAWVEAALGGDTAGPLARG